MRPEKHSVLQLGERRPYSAAELVQYALDLLWILGLLALARVVGNAGTMASAYNGERIHM